MEETHFRQLLKILDDAGWCLALPSLDGEEEITGMIIGTPDYVNLITRNLPGDLDFVKSAINDHRETKM